MDMGETWIIFIAEPEQPGWENRKLPMGGLHFSYQLSVISYQYRPLSLRIY